MRTLTKEQTHHPAGIEANTEQGISPQQRRKSYSKLFLRGKGYKNGGGRVNIYTIHLAIFGKHIK